MSTVILAEKPSQAKDYAAAFDKTKQKGGYIEVLDNNFFNDTAYITWGYGHLVELVEPKTYKEEWGKWDLKSLPIIPEEFKLQVPEDKKKQFNIVKKLLKDSDEIIIGTDPDREGENIARSTIEMAGASNKPMKRLWVNSPLPEAIKEGFNNLKHADNYIGMYKEAQTRQYSDWLIGMNLSRLYTLLLQEKDIHESFSIGRVQTPTLYLIYEREKEIKNFVPKPFFEILANISVENGTFKAKYKEKFDTPEKVKEILSKYQINQENEVTIDGVEKVDKVTKAPSLYSLSGLQTKAGNKWKYSPKVILDTVQELYEKKLLTYPRTDTKYIGDGEFKYLFKNVHDYQKVISSDFEIVYTEPRKKYVDGSKVQEHHAIIPTEKIPNTTDIDSLNEVQKNIYFEVVRNTLAMFAPDYKYEQTTITAIINELSFEASGKVEIDKGWRVLFPSKKEDENDTEDTKELPLTNEGEKGNAKLDIHQGKTKSPKPYTQTNLINVMKTAGKSVEDEDEREILKETEGIGTEATRAAIIDTLLNQNYIVSDKSNKVSITSKGEIICQAIENTIISSASMTATWEQHLKKVGTGEGSQENFLQNIRRIIEKMITETPNQIKDNNQLNQTISNLKSEFKKPKKTGGKYKKYKKKKATNK